LGYVDLYSPCKLGLFWRAPQQPIPNNIRPKWGLLLSIIRDDKPKLHSLSVSKMQKYE